jgi:hypothetical protein
MDDNVLYICLTGIKEVISELHAAAALSKIKSAGHAVDGRILKKNDEIEN